MEFEAYNAGKPVLRDALTAAGLQCEIESYNHNDKTHWKIVNDGSINGNDTFELVSPILQGGDGMRQLEKACFVLNACGAKVNKSCGTHVHLGAAGFFVRAVEADLH